MSSVRRAIALVERGASLPWLDANDMSDGEKFREMKLKSLYAQLDPYINRETRGLFHWAYVLAIKLTRSTTSAISSPVGAHIKTGCWISWLICRATWAKSRCRDALRYVTKFWVIEFGREWDFEVVWPLAARNPMAGAYLPMLRPEAYRPNLHKGWRGFRRKTLSEPYEAIYDGSVDARGVLIHNGRRHDTAPGEAVAHVRAYVESLPRSRGPNHQLLRSSPLKPYDIVQISEVSRQNPVGIERPLSNDGSSEDAQNRGEKSKGNTIHTHRTETETGTTVETITNTQGPNEAHAGNMAHKVAAQVSNLALVNDMAQDLTGLRERLEKMERVYHAPGLAEIISHLRQGQSRMEERMAAWPGHFEVFECQMKLRAQLLATEGETLAPEEDTMGKTFAETVSHELQVTADLMKQTVEHCDQMLEHYIGASRFGVKHLDYPTRSDPWGRAID